MSASLPLEFGHFGSGRYCVAINSPFSSMIFIISASYNSTASPFAGVGAKVDVGIGVPLRASLKPISHRKSRSAARQIFYASSIVWWTEIEGASAVRAERRRVLIMAGSLCVPLKKQMGYQASSSPTNFSKILNKLVKKYFGQPGRPGWVAWRSAFASAEHARVIGNALSLFAALPPGLTPQEPL